MIPTETPVIIPSNIYALVYLILALVIGPAGMAFAKSWREWRADVKAGRKDRVAAMEEWNLAIIKERDFYYEQSKWRGDLIGRLEYEINSNPHFGPDVVRKVRESMPPEPKWSDHMGHLGEEKRSE